MEKRVALITGGTRGMGASEVYEFAARGYDVMFNYVKSDVEAQRIRADIEKRFGVRATAMRADLSCEGEVRGLATAALETFGRVDVLVNNAGIALYGEFADKDIDGWDRSMRVNLYAPFLLTQLLAPRMVERRYGKIVNIATIDVMTTYNAQSAEYDASKAVLISLTKTSSLEYAPYVNVNCVCPGWVATDMNKELPQELLDYQASKTCKGRMAKPEEVAKLVAFLASDDAEFIDGEIIKIDGGYRLS